MPVHDWKRVLAGTFHAFHTAWIAELQSTLNGGLLPPEYYVLAEQVAGDTGPDILALHAPGLDEPSPSRSVVGLAVAEAPPRVAWRSEADEALMYADKRKVLVIRHSSGDAVVALIEIVSPGNKSDREELRKFVHKARSALRQEVHLLVLDLLPPGPTNPAGIHPEIWRSFNSEDFVLPAEKPLTLAAYAAGMMPVAYVEPVAIGQALPPMPLFLTPDTYINVPLEETYQAAYAGVPERWRRVIEGRTES